MQNRVNTIAIEQVCKQSPVAYVTLDEDGFAATYLANPPDDRGVAVAQVVQHDHFMTCFEQGYTGM